MVEPRIEGFSPQEMGNVPNIRGMAKELKDDIDQFNDLIPPRPDQINDFGTSIENLDESSLKALQMTKKPSNKLMVEVQDSALTIQNILTQPLSLGETEQNVSLVSAAKRHKSVSQGESELSKIGMAFMQYPDQTQALKAELLLTSHDLKN
jgi:hypothetical protein